ncbi:D-alanyl-D-alanine carboxypeptidase family protein [Cytobacillus sp. IB215316]|uniref:D-alanyl-D-alanine carboxypeptidase family protein n=1 Tax=Cytobacillus sp. IB215316 TaxID=3097354 RepID=UPI002A12479E|nr:D-alanyl-D-alanine carboxypeptidase family protein [Cytobacillus sp. IB215316]MDX8359766.1 D-alanyl-D-alanine carboxypeptidase family protein [Cytobacillus sp. IB215316]
MVCMRKCMTFLLIIVLLLSVNQQAAVANNDVSAKSAILIEQETGRTLYGKNEHTKMRIASITKIMTAIIAIESGKLEDIVDISERAIYTEGSSIHLELGDQITLKDLVYGLMLRSGNDAAVAIAEHVGGSVEGFNFLMNEKAAMIGMTNSEFSNPHGLDDHENHYSTAYDMALLTKYAMENKAFRELFETKLYHPIYKSKAWKNKHKLVTGMYSYTTGGKTGYTKRANRTLVTTAEKNGLELIAVTLDSNSNDWNDHISMFETGFDQYNLINIFGQDNLEMVKDEFYKNKIFVERDVLYPLNKEEENEVNVAVQLIKPQKSWKKNKDVPTIIGKVVISLSDDTIEEIPVFYDHGNRKSKKSWWPIFSQVFAMIIGVNSDG